MDAETKRVVGWRDQQGRFDYFNEWDRLCVCGHSLGVHYAESPRECCLNTFGDKSGKEHRDHANSPPEDCGCDRFRPKRSKGKFVYLQKPKD